MDESLGKVIAQRRTELGITQRELARGVKISNSTVSRIEHDDNITPDNETLRAIVAACRYRAGEHCLRQARCHGGRDRCRRQSGPRRQLHPPPAQGL